MPILTPDANWPPLVNVVTQATSPQLTQEFDLISMPAQGIHNNNFREEEHQDFQKEYILEHANSETTLLMESSTVPHYPTPTNRSSEDTSNKRICNMVESSTIMNTRDIAEAANTMVALSNSASKL